VATILARGHLSWHPTLGRDIEQVTDDELADRLRRLPFGGCCLAAAADGDRLVAYAADLLGVSRERGRQLDESGIAKVRRLVDPPR